MSSKRLSRRNSNASVEPTSPRNAAKDSNKLNMALNKPRNTFAAPSVADIVQDNITKLSLEYWATGNTQKKNFSANIIDEIYNSEIATEVKSYSRIMLLELSFYLENYLWPNYTHGSSDTVHLISIMEMINEKCRENVPAWECFLNDLPKAHQLMFDLVALSLNSSLEYREKTTCTIFLINFFQSMWHEVVKPVAMRLVSLPIWNHLDVNLRNSLFEQYPKLEKTWKTIVRVHEQAMEGVMDVQTTTETSPKQTNSKSRTSKSSKANSSATSTIILPLDGPKVAGSVIPIVYEKSFLYCLLLDYFRTLRTFTNTSVVAEDSWKIRYLERFVELVIDWLSQLPTRRFFRTLLESLHFIVISRRSSFFNMDQAKVFRQLISIAHFYQGFEISDFTGEALTDSEISKLHYDRIQRTQSMAFNKFMPQLQRFVFSSVSAVDTKQALLNILEPLSEEELMEFCAELFLIPSDSKSKGNTLEHIPTLSKDLLIDILISHLEKRQSQLDSINAKSLYPDEKLLWEDVALDPPEQLDDVPLTLPKLNLQFLTFHDYLLRNFTLFRLESAYQIRSDLEDAIHRMQPRKTVAGTTVLRGWARKALPLSSFSVKHVGNPLMGEKYPSVVTAEAAVYLPGNSAPSLRAEWDSLKKHDVVFLVSIDATQLDGFSEVKQQKGHKSHKASNSDPSQSFARAVGVVMVRGAEIVDLLDDQGKVISDQDIDDVGRDPKQDRSKRPGRIIRLNLDPVQYHLDSLASQTSSKAAIDVDDTLPAYKSLNIVIRRSAKANNFKAVLDTIRKLMNAHFLVPDWLKNILLGYGDPSASTDIEKATKIDFVDTFLSIDHLKQSFPSVVIQEQPSPAPTSNSQPLFKVYFDSPNQISVEAYEKKSKSPYPAPFFKRNPIQFTPTQVEAIRRSMNKGVTLVVGPPGTGKTDVAVQIVSNWYHNFPHQRTLIVTHSNTALNQLFEKIMILDVDDKHLLRLGHGGELLETEMDFSKSGRVNRMLQLRLNLLSRVNKLASSLHHPTDVAYSVETAKNFFTYTIRAKWEKFLLQSAQTPTVESIASNFPFSKFFDDLSTYPNLFASYSNFSNAAEYANLLWNELQTLFSDLEECRPFEVLRSIYDRGNYLLTKQARIVAMTCTHASLKRADFVKLGFKFDNILMEESAQILEIETFIPIVLQESKHAASEGATEQRLKRVVLIGDHNQLPPIIQNAAFQRYAHLDQSFFTRLVRLGVPTITLDAQGRARPSIADLYSWRYKGLSNLPHVTASQEFNLANAGFTYDYQFVNVEDYNGHGETEPNPYFYQNLGEAEYLVATYMYMRMIGYPREKISIITSYNGQKHLIRDVLNQRCAGDPRFGMPAKVTTVDRFQGQQNDYILLSLVRTRFVGHIRDVRRLVVAMSRARLGLYIFGRMDLFKDCYELTPTFSKLLQRPTNLSLIKNEIYGKVKRQISDPVSTDSQFISTSLYEIGQVILPAYTSTAINDHESSSLMHEDDISNKECDGSSSSSSDVGEYQDPILLRDEGVKGKDDHSMEVDGDPE